MLSKINHSQANMLGFCLDEISIVVRFLETESKTVDAGAGKMGEQGVTISWIQSFSFTRWGAQKMASGGDCNLHLTPLSSMLTDGYAAKFYMYFPTIKNIFFTLKNTQNPPVNVVCSQDKNKILDEASSLTLATLSCTMSPTPVAVPWPVCHTHLSPASELSPVRRALSLTASRSQLPVFLQFPLKLEFLREAFPARPPDLRFHNTLLSI